MDRKLLEKSLAQAERHVAEAEHEVSRQRMVVAGLELRGHDSSRATHVLRQFEQLQAKHIAERDRVRKELDL
jgi:hypothetical protein